MVDFRLDRQSFMPFYRQIMDMILSGISAGAILPGEKLPTVRDLAVRLEVNPNTVMKAYSQLQLLGVLNTQQGSGVFVSLTPEKHMPEESKERATRALCQEFVSRAQLQNLGIDDLVPCLVRMREQLHQQQP